MSKPESKIFNDFMKLDLKSIDINSQTAYKEIKKDMRQGRKLSRKEFREELKEEVLDLMRVKLEIRNIINK
ncbi:MAG: hypothetical protein GOVbin2513_7 [Prokaryotic dsDNA virus sp.]|nr:MAG: hypothetical protein GOVbin2513_7 [Prokaryotic dsDNA virus sp.]|tara:strand:+ start:8028 stop:8240 length:213 start_codon:yes stop_codon:yes gene_type:complete